MDTIDHFCHSFMKFHPPKLEAIPDDLYEIYKDVITGAYRFQDMMLERMMALVDDDTTIIVMSDHGYESGKKRLIKMPKYQAAPALEHRQFGVFVAAGPNIKKNEKIFGLGLIDVAPTILHMYGLPIGKDMDGNVALEIFETPTKPEYIDSWEHVEGDFGQHQHLSETQQLSDQDALEQLIELGYIERPDEKIETAVHKTKCDLQHNLARVYTGKKDYDKAKAILLELVKEQAPIDVVPYYMDLLTISLNENDYDNAEVYLNQLRTLDKQFEIRTYFAEAKILLNKGRVRTALKLLTLAKDKRPNGEVWFQIGKIYMQLNQFENAKSAFEEAIDFEVDNAKYHQALAVALVRLGHYEESVEHALTSIELVKYFPDAHYVLGEALEKMGELEHAKIAYDTAKRLTPKTHYRAEAAIDNIEKVLNTAIELNDKADFAYRENQIVIVSGLPRSGTSLMMQMLHHGGLDTLTDELRKPDDSNPKGYFEYKPVMSLHKDNSWLYLAQNKSLKVVAPLLKFLKPEFRYKVIFMNRDLTEVVKSQQKMIGKDTETLPVRLFESYKKQLEAVAVWKDKEPQVELIYLDYKDLINFPQKGVDEIVSFIGSDLDKDKMMGAIDSSLYRNKT